MSDCTDDALDTYGAPLRFVPVCTAPTRDEHPSGLHMRQLLPGVHGGRHIWRPLRHGNVLIGMSSGFADLADEPRLHVPPGCPGRCFRLAGNDEQVATKLSLSHNPYHVALSTRPADFLGTEEQWMRAEADLASALEAAGVPFALNPGDGAFHGPKIDVSVVDAHGRRIQCATGQLDFQLPERFDLKYVSPSVAAQSRPVIIHRAILGSAERVFALLAESYGGKWLSSENGNAEKAV